MSSKAVEIFSQVLEVSEFRRSQNWKHEEMLALTEAVKERNSILFGKLDNRTSAIDKNKAWNEVLLAVNAVSSVTRTLKQCQEKYKGLKKSAKAAAANNKREFRKTGGGTADVVDLDECANNILSTLPTAQVEGIEGGIDTSGITNAGTNTNRDKTDLDPTPCLKLVVTEPSTNSSSHRCDNDPPTNQPSTSCKEPSSQCKTPKRARFQSPTEILLEKQVELVQEQVNVLKNMEVLMKERNEIEKQKLELERFKVFGKIRSAVPKFQEDTSVD